MKANTDIYNMSASNEDGITFPSSIESQFLVYWWICQSTSLLCTVISVYLLVCVSLYVYKQIMFGEGHIRNTSVNSSSNPVERSVEKGSTSRRPIQRGHRKRNARCIPGKRMDLALLGTLVFNFLNAIEQQFLLNMGDSSNAICNFLAKFMITLTGLSIHFCILFLWLRQLVFYSNPLLGNLRSKYLTAFSYGTYLLSLITFLAALIIHIWWRDYAKSNIGCVPLPSSIKINKYTPFILLAGFTVTLQCCLSFLFIYPIFAHNRKNKRSTTAESNSEQVKNSNRRKQRLLRCVKRVLLGASVTITTDIIGALVAMLFPDDFPLYTLAVLYHLDILLNISCLLFSYIDWKAIVFPFLVNANRIQFSASINGNHQ